MNRLLIDLKSDCNGDIVGRVSLPADSKFALEAFLLAIEQFSKNCDIPVCEILDDMKILYNPKKAT